MRSALLSAIRPQICLPLAVLALLAFVHLSPAAADARGPGLACDSTIAGGEPVREFLDRLGPDRTGCLTAGTYTIGNLNNFQPGQRLVAASDARGNRDRVTLRGTLRLDQPGIELHDLFVVGVSNPENDKVISVNSCDFCVIDHLDITSFPAYQDFQGILNNTPTRGLRITNNRIHHIGNEGGHDHGIYCRAPMRDGVIEGNWLYRNAAYGIIFYTDCDGVEFRYNVVANNGVFEDCNPDAPPGSRCPVTRDNGRGIAISGQPDEGLGQTDSALVRNSIISSSARFGENALLHCYQPGSANTVRDVVVDWSWGSDPSGDDCDGGGVSFRNIGRRLDPGFRSERRDDYRLRRGSRAYAVLGPFADRVPGPRVFEPAGRPAKLLRSRPACAKALPRTGRSRTRWCARPVAVRHSL